MFCLFIILIVYPALSVVNFLVRVYIGANRKLTVAVDMVVTIVTIVATLIVVIVTVVIVTIFIVIVDRIVVSMIEVVVTVVVVDMQLIVMVRCRRVNSHRSLITRYTSSVFTSVFK